jgi:hypothetical protein
MILCPDSKKAPGRTSRNNRLVVSTGSRLQACSVPTGNFKEPTRPGTPAESDSAAVPGGPGQPGKNASMPDLERCILREAEGGSTAKFQIVSRSK